LRARQPAVADPNTTVLLVEAGGKDDWFWIDIPVGYLYTIANPRTDWCYKTQPDEHLAGRSIHYARGRVLGGCSSINAMIYMRGQKSDYDYWASLGNAGWSWNDVLPLFRKVEDYQHGADEMHGAGGELRVEESRVRWEILEAWRNAAEECGIPKIPEFNRGDNFGSAYFQMNQKRGVRWSATKAFLRPVLSRPNLTVMTNVLVERLRIGRRNGLLRSEGIELAHARDGRSFAEARRETILAAGSIGSPQLLQLSGVGPAGTLRARGVEPVLDLAGVGENLHDHLQIRMQYKVKNTVTLNERVNSVFGKIAMAAEYALFKTGPLTMPPSQLGAFARSNPAQPTANIEWHVQPLSLDKFGDPLHTFPAITPSVCNLRPFSRGWVRIVSPDPAAYPEIKLNYLDAPEDRAIAVDAMRFTRRIMAARALARFEPDEFRPGPGYQTDDELTRGAGELGTTIFHPVGTCKMGDDVMAVVDDRLRVRGIQDLRVVDASIMPRITSGNTNAPVYMIAEKGSAMILEDRSTL
jgi:choline dehydrogenase